MFGHGHFPPDGFFICASLHPTGQERMNKTRQMALQVAKEIVVKFIEIGRISPSNFDQFFSSIYFEVLRTISEEEQSDHSRDEDGHQAS
jgi:hypothetical protein